MRLLVSAVHELCNHLGKVYEIAKSESCTDLRAFRIR
jgi:hypothetical protein